MVPTVAVPLTTLFTVQTTVVFADPVTVALNCCVAPTLMIADAGDIFIETPAVDEVTVIAWGPEIVPLAIAPN